MANIGDIDLERLRKENPDVPTDKLIYDILAPYIDPAYETLKGRNLADVNIPDIPRKVVMSPTEQAFGQVDEAHFHLIKTHERNSSIETSLNNFKVIAPVEVFPGQEAEDARNACKNYVGNFYNQLFTSALQYEDIARISPFLDKYKYVPRSSLNKADAVYANIRDKQNKYVR